MTPTTTPPTTTRSRKSLRFSLLGLIEKLAILGAITVILGIIGGFWLIVTAGPHKAPVTIVIPRGASVMTIADILEGRGSIHHPLLFRAAAKFIALNHLKAGEYELAAEQSIADIVLQMYIGDTIIRQITLVEGATVADTVAALHNNTSLMGTIDTLPAEGSLLPETYNYSFGDLRNDLISRMQRDMDQFLEEAWKNRNPNLPLKSRQEAVILASLIEKETGKADERARIAGVFYNRLRIPMRLQSDPTVIYAIEREKGSLGRPLGHNDLSFPSPYNTYASDGLPPTPICNPGKAAILAALHPEEHTDIYFMADGAGGHRFAPTLDEHNRNINMYRGLRPSTDPLPSSPTMPIPQPLPAASPAPGDDHPLGSGK